MMIAMRMLLALVLLQLARCEVTQADIDEVELKIAITKKKIEIVDKILADFKKDRKGLKKERVKAKKDTEKEIKEKRLEIKGKFQSLAKQKLKNEKKEIKAQINALRKDVKNVWNSKWVIKKKNSEIEKITAKVSRQIDELDVVGSEDFEELRKELYDVSKQVQRQQFVEYEKARTDGDSGVTQIKARRHGNENYYSEDYNGYSFAGFTDLKDNQNTLAMKEIVGMLNGVMFKTSSQKYSLDPTTAVKVPRSISDNTDMIEQIISMRKIFNDFATQAEGGKWRQMFPAYLNFLEGAWVNSDQVDPKEKQKMLFSAYTGLNDRFESLAYNPSSIIGFDEKKPIYATWKTNIHSFRLNEDLPTSFFKRLSDPVTKRRYGWEDDKDRPSNRFDLNGLNADVVAGEKIVRESNRVMYSYLDHLMEQVPGMDGDKVSGENKWAQRYIAKETAGKDAPTHVVTGKKIDQFHYHSAYTVKVDKMHDVISRAGFADKVYVALTTKSEIEGVKDDKDGTVRYTYAVPLEVVYRTPLETWNPFQIPQVENCDEVVGKGTKAAPYEATCKELFYVTPEAFYTIDADSQQANFHKCLKDGVYFKSPLYGSPVCVAASGSYTILPEINGVQPQIRLRYPIMPVSSEGSGLSKEVNAFKDSVLALHVKPTFVEYQTGDSNHAHVPGHHHTFQLSALEQQGLLSGKLKEVKARTEPDSFHQHVMTIASRKTADGNYETYIKSCNGTPADAADGHLCFDGHLNTATAA